MSVIINVVRAIELAIKKFDNIIIPTNLILLSLNGSGVKRNVYKLIGVRLRASSRSTIYTYICSHN